jgi:type IV pilus assembly protein PilB
MEIPAIAKRLVKKGVLSTEDAQDAIKDAAENNQSLVSHLVTKDNVDTTVLAKLLSQETGMPYFDLQGYDVESTPTDVEIKPAIMEKNLLFPLYKRGESLFIAMYDPSNTQVLDDLKFQTNLVIEPIITEYYRLSDVIREVVSKAEINYLSNMDDDALDSLQVNDDAETLEEAVNEQDTPIVRFINKVILEAISSGASDIHLEPYEHMYRIRLRQDGLLREYGQPPVNLSQRLASRIKIMSKLDISEKRIPQDGRFKLRISKTQAIDFRVSTCPTLFGEKIVMRILDPTSAKMGIDALGYEDFQKEAFLKAINLSQGMVLVTGPTGSGKTVSLYTALNILNVDHINISTVEDPVEINLAGINQVNVNVKAGLTFPAALRSFLRQDPDIIMLGEIRDLETAEIAVKAAQTGHMVLSTLHTNSAPETLTRLINMGVPAFNVATSVHLIIAQRLARRLCESCKEEIEVPEKALVEIGFTEEEISSGLKVFKPVGCKKCKEGYKGRVGLYEVMPISKTIGEIIMNGGTSLDISSQATKEGVWFLRKSGLHKVKQGLTSLEEVSRVTRD